LNVLFYVKGEDLQFMLAVSLYVSGSCIMAWWWSEFRVETGRHIYV